MMSSAASPQTDRRHTTQSSRRAQAVRTEIAVVIPYFQEQPGILARALRSVSLQRLPAEAILRVIVVDDQSPARPQKELPFFEMPAPHRLVLLEQANGGPGAARNTALDELVRRPVDFVAFLDSDDEWLPDHLATAISALDRDGEFFFADHTRRVP